jgi:hypothetical protein
LNKKLAALVVSGIELSYAQFHSSVQMRPGSTPEFAFYNDDTVHPGSKMAKLYLTDRGVIAIQKSDIILVDNPSYVRFKEKLSGTASSQEE